MNLGPIPLASTAGTSLAQTRGSEADRAQRDAAVHARQTHGDQRAEAAAGIGANAEGQASGERDADGRRLWEDPSEEHSHNASTSSPDSAVSRDSTGQLGHGLDLTG